MANIDFSLDDTGWVDDVGQRLVKLRRDGLINRKSLIRAASTLAMYPPDMPKPAVVPTRTKPKRSVEFEWRVKKIHLRIAFQKKQTYVYIDDQRTDPWTFYSGPLNEHRALLQTMLKVMSGDMS